MSTLRNNSLVEILEQRYPNWDLSILRAWWVDWYVNWYFKLHMHGPLSRHVFWLSPLFVGGMIYLIGLLMAVIGGFSKSYLMSLPFYYGVLGISFFIFASYLVLVRYVPALLELEKVYDTSDSTKPFKKIIQDFSIKVVSLRGNLITALLFMAPLIAVTDYYWLQPDLIEKSILGQMLAGFMSPEWYVSPLLWKLLIIDLFAICVLIIIAITTRVLALGAKPVLFMENRKFETGTALWFTYSFFFGIESIKA